MKLLFVADPLEAFKPHKDTTFAMMREAARRGHVLHACEPKHLSWRSGGQVIIPAQMIDREPFHINFGAALSALK